MKKSIIFSAIAALGIATSAAMAAPSLLAISTGVSTTAASPGSAVTSLSVTSGTIVYVYFFGSTNTLQDPASNNVEYAGSGYEDTTGQSVAGGIRGTELDLKSGGTASYSTGSTATVFSPNVKSNFSTTPPARTADGSVFDAIGYSFTDSGSFGDVTMGTPESGTAQTSGAFAGDDYLGYEKWTVTGTTTFAPTVVGPIYYDSTSASNFQSNYSGSSVASAIVKVPEPASLSLLGLGALSLAARRRRA